MALFRYSTGTQEKFVELGWPQGGNAYNSPISLVVTEKKDDEFVKKENLGTFNYDKEKAKAGYTFKSSLGDITVKWVRKFLIVEEIQVFLGDQRLKGSEVVALRDGTEIGKFA